MQDHVKNRVVSCQTVLPSPEMRPQRPCNNPQSVRMSQACRQAALHGSRGRAIPVQGTSLPRTCQQGNPKKGQHKQNDACHCNDALAVDHTKVINPPFQVGPARLQPCTNTLYSIQGAAHTLACQSTRHLRAHWRVRAHRHEYTDVSTLACQSTQTGVSCNNRLAGKVMQM